MGDSSIIYLVIGGVALYYIFFMGGKDQIMSIFNTPPSQLFGTGSGGGGGGASSSGDGGGEGAIHYDVSSAHGENFRMPGMSMHIGPIAGVPDESFDFGDPRSPGFKGNLTSFIQNQIRKAGGNPNGNFQNLKINRNINTGGSRGVNQSVDQEQSSSSSSMGYINSFYSQSLTRLSSY